MAILQSCCGYLDVKTGSKVIASILIVISLAGLGFTAYGTTVASAVGVVSPTNVILLSVYSLSVSNHTLLIITIAKAKKPRPMISAWGVVTWICTFAVLGIYSFTTVQAVALMSAIASSISPGLNQDAFKAGYVAGIAIVWTICGINFMLTVYGTLVVMSHYQNLRDAAMGQGQQQVAMGNLAGNQPYMPVGNQPYMPVGNQPYMPVGNQPYMPGQV
ncbi:hypothetical protein Bbelb_055560 [Branchiostoma belcheri]|nr:hypothetical protein Bbelb_055560 [Branchiostoma belcheri]